MNVQLEIERLQHVHKLQLQSLYNEYTMAVARINSDLVYEITKLSLLPQQPALQQPIPQPIPQQPPQQPPQPTMSTEEFTDAVNKLNGRVQQPSTKHHENHPGPQEPSKVVSQITKKVMEQTTEEEDEQALSRRKEVQRFSLMLEGETVEKAREKVRKENKELWFYRANSSIQMNPPLDENPRQVIVNVIDDDFDFNTFTPSNNAIVSAVVGVGVLGGL